MTTISRISKVLAVVAAATACAMFECVPAQLCYSQWHGASGLQGNLECTHEYLVKYGQNIGSLISSPPPSLAASVQ